MDEAEGLIRLIVQGFRDAPAPSVEVAVEEILRTVEPWYLAAVNANGRSQLSEQRPSSEAKADG
jgi:hypothetical protein